ncbi:hypothetical protein [Confluentibacter lentus]|uniref:hypothetical protein n=1 Tax=Confluentibacter lentus TaxID=1699412 RepID=UPI000C284272|nr:hypothetical protein [Confluentibacter lentus]
MHRFEKLIYRSTSFTLGALQDANSKIIEELQTSGSTILLKNLQMIQLQKAIFAVGMFSIFDATLQHQLSCRNGFEGAKNTLKDRHELDLHDRFDEFICAINVLKHGEGRSYDFLVSKSKLLPFKVKLRGENFFEEGDVSEINTLIEVDDNFVLNCA